MQQVQAHWLVWLATAFLLWVAFVGVRDIREPARRGYLIVFSANLLYAGVAIVHFFQHLNHLEVDWAHVLLVISGVVAAVGVVWVVVERLMARRGEREAPR